MALDIGSKRIGVAVTDPLKMTAQPLLTIERGDLSNDIQRVLKLAEEFEVSRIVVGRPLTLSGKRGSIFDLVESFLEALEEASTLKIVWADERLSTKEAESLMSELGMELPKQKMKRDQYAAALILTWYLEENPVG
jgi:putative Holliday junction resolvase